jgi:hypothetical protein
LALIDLGKQGEVQFDAWFYQQKMFLDLEGLSLNRMSTKY